MDIVVKKDVIIDDVLEVVDVHHTLNEIEKVN